jgi:hypothetical protein
MFIERCTFTENRSMSSNGGGGAGENQQSLYVNNSTFANNKSTELGGAINNYGGTSYFVDCTFVGNVAYGSHQGGAIAHHNDGTVTLVNSLFACNYRNNGSAYRPRMISTTTAAPSQRLLLCFPIHHEPTGQRQCRHHSLYR